MDKPEPKRSLVRISKSFETTCYIWFAAPYSLSETVPLPEGMILNLCEYEDREEPYRFEASPVDSEKWAPFIISADHRHDKNFRHNYNFHFKQEEVEQFCQALEQITEAIACGGDTDTVAAIIGGIVGANVGKDGIPEDWLENLKDWPRDKKYLHCLCEDLVAVKWTNNHGRTQWMDGSNTYLD